MEDKKIQFGKKVFELTIPSLPPTDNHLYGQRGKIKFMYPEGKKWKQEVYDLAKSNYGGQILEQNLEADVWIYFKRDRDVHGGLKVLFDAFEGVLYKNDKQIRDQHSHKRKNDISKINPFIIVKFYETDSNN